MGEKNDIAIVRKGTKQLLIDSGLDVKGKLSINGLDILAQLTALKTELAQVKDELKKVSKISTSWTKVQSSIEKIKPDTAAFKQLVKENWNGDYSPWFRWEIVAKGANGPQYGDIRVRFKNTYDEWVSSHKGDDVGKLKAYWSASIPALKVTYRDWPGLVRAVMLGEKFGSGPSIGLHYKRTHNGEHYPWWQPDGTLTKNGAHDWGGYLCTKTEVCGYNGCQMYDKSSSTACIHKEGKVFGQIISVCTALNPAKCDPSWEKSTWSVVQSSVPASVKTNHLLKYQIANPNTANFKDLVKRNWDGAYSPWIKWEVYTEDMSGLYADIRIRFKNTYDEWATSHKGDDVGKLKAYWSASIPSLKVSYRDWTGLVRAVMLGEKFGSGPSVGLHYKRTNNGEHYPWWQASGVLQKNGAHDWGGYLCTKPDVCGYDGCVMYDTGNSDACSHKAGKKFQQVLSVCNGAASDCAPTWKASTWTNVQSNFIAPSMGNMNQGWYKALMKMNWNGEYSPWVRWEIYGHDKNTLYADIRVRFKNNYDDWVASHKGDNIGKLKAYWSANIPDLKVSYRNKEGLVRAVMMGVDNGGGYFGWYTCINMIIRFLTQCSRDAT